MSTISLRLPDSLHKQVRKLAEKEKVSINQLINAGSGGETFRTDDGRLSRTARKARQSEEVPACDVKSSEGRARRA